MRNKTINIKGKNISVHRSFQEKIDYIKKSHPNLTSTASVVEFSLDLLYMKEKGEMIMFTKEEMETVRTLKLEKVDLSKIREIKVSYTPPDQEPV